MISFLFAAILHECGHLFALFIIFPGKRRPRLRLSPLGAVLSTVRFPSYGSAIACYLAGPAVNLLTAAVSAGDLREASLSLAVFNLLPVDGLDGGNALRELLCFLWNDSAADIVLRVAGILCFCLFFLSALCLLLAGSVNLMPLCLSLWMLCRLLTA